MKFSGAFNTVVGSHIVKDSDFGADWVVDETAEVYISKVIYSEPATIVFWSDNTKTVSKCDERDIYDKRVGLALCITKKLVGGSKLKKCFEDWCPEDENFVTIHDVRKKNEK